MGGIVVQKFDHPVMRNLIIAIISKDRLVYVVIDVGKEVIRFGWKLL